MGQTTTNQTTTAQAPSWQLPYQQYGLNQAQAQYNGVSSPQQLVAGFSPMQDQALSGIQNVASNNPTSGAVNDYVTNTLNGNPANNPYLNSEFTQAANQTQDRLSSEFAGAGRGTVGSMPLRSDELNNLATSLYGGAYNTGVQQKENAAAMAPGAVNTAMGLQQGLFDAGGQVQNLAQRYIQAPQDFLNQYLSRANNSLGQTYTQPQYFNNGLGAVGGGSLGASLGGMLGGAFGGNGSNYGQLAGGLLGALAGSNAFNGI